MTVAELIEKLKALPQDLPVRADTVDQWNQLDTEDDINDPVVRRSVHGDYVYIDAG